MPASGRVIGVDESGKGDFFGPLVVAALLADNQDIRKLTEIGVRDSKKIAPKKLLSIDAVLRQQFPHSIVVISPTDYNDKYEDFRNLNKLLAWAHVSAIEAIPGRQAGDRAVSDKFGKDERIEEALARLDDPIEVEMIVRGERIAQVGAASILARAAFVREMDRLSSELGVELPKGAAPQVDEAGRRVVEQFGVQKLREVAKIHFKNYRRATDPQLFA